MKPVRNQRSIFHRQQVTDALSAIADRMEARTEQRAAVLEHLKGVLEAGRAEIRQRFDAGADGPTTARAYAYLIDQLITVIYDFAVARVYPEPNPTASDRLGLIAVGGYGRGELAPQSDVDLLFLVPYKQVPRGEHIVEFMLYLLWDLGLKVGQACRADITTKNPAKVKQYMKNFELVEKKIAEVLEKDEMREFQSPVRGEEIMELFGIGPGKIIGLVKRAIEQAILDGIIDNEYEASYNYLIKNKDNWLEEFKDS